MWYWKLITTFSSRLPSMPANRLQSHPQRGRRHYEGLEKRERRKESVYETPVWRFPVLTRPMHSIHIKIDEKITLRANRDGGLDDMDVKGTMLVSVYDESKGRLQVAISKDANKNMSYQVQRAAFLACDGRCRLRSRYSSHSFARHTPTWTRKRSPTA